MNRIGADVGRSPSARGAVEVPGLRVGASVVIRAVCPAGNGEWTVLLNGVRLTTRVSGPLEPGSMYSARAERLPDRSGWFFRVLGPVVEGRALKVPPAAPPSWDALTTLAVRALMSETLPLNPGNISRMRSILSRRELSEERTALAARALAKGLDPESMADALEAVQAYTDASGSRNGNSGGGDGGFERNAEKEADAHPSSGSAASEEGKPESGSPSGECPPVWREAPPVRAKGDDVRELAALLRFLAFRASDDPNPYQLFNSRSGPGGRWIYAPYRFTREGVAFSGTLRILVPEGSDQARSISADVLSEDEGRERRYSFRVLRSGGGYSLTLFSEDPSTRKRLAETAAALRRELDKNGCSVRVGPSASDGSPESGYVSVDDHA